MTGPDPFESGDEQVAADVASAGRSCLAILVLILVLIAIVGLSLIIRWLTGN